MFENLETIDWSKLRHAYGEASDVPKYLRSILSADEKEREDAFFGLFNTIFHQGKVYEASAYAVPFLFELLACDETPDKHSVANLLASLADGHSYLEAHASFEWLKPVIEKQLAADGLEWATELENERHWVRVCRQAVGQNIERLYGYLQDEDEENRMAIACALALYPERAAETIPLLEAALSIETQEDVQEQIRDAITRLGQGAS